MAGEWMTMTKTLTGILLADLDAELNKQWPQAAMTTTPKGRGGTGNRPAVKPEFVRQRINEIFGPHGIGWRFTPHPTLGSKRMDIDERTNGNGEIQTWYVCVQEMIAFEYCVVHDDGQLEWLRTSYLSDVHENLDQKSAYRGVMSSLLKQAFRSMGGFRSLDAKSQPSTQNANGNTNGKPDKSAWGQWVLKNRKAGFSDADMLKALGGISKFSEWTGTLAEADKALDAWHVQQKQSTSVTEDLPPDMPTCPECKSTNYVQDFLGDWSFRACGYIKRD